MKRDTRPGAKDGTGKPSRGSRPSWGHERRAQALGFTCIAGIDEAGRGALAGPVVAAAVVLDSRRCPGGIRDSKLLTALARERLYEEIVSTARAWGAGIADAAEIDACNVLEATRRAMKRAIEALAMRPDYLIVDAVALPELGIEHEHPVKADRHVISVAAASIVAKVTRDRMLAVLDADHAGYGFAIHKGYGTREHFQAIAARGLCTEHRRSFADISCGTLFSPDEFAAGLPPRPARRPSRAPEARGEAR
jgi:ribonuclease HII